MKARKNKPLFETVEVKKIKFSNNPFSLKNITELSLDEFQKMIATRRNLPDFFYTESLIVPDWFESKGTDFSEFQNIKPADKLIVCDMKETGLALFTSIPIKKGDVVAVYAGSSDATKSIGDHYLMMNFNMQTIPNNLKKIMETPLDERDGLINPVYTAEKMGGLASFMQSLPDASRLQCPYPNMEQIITTANLTQTIHLFTSTSGKKIGLVSLVATRNIKAGEQIGFDYGEQYFENFGIEELYFDKTNGNAYPKIMIDFPKELLDFLFQSIASQDLLLTRDLLCSLHPHILNILCEMQNELPIKDFLLKVASLNVEIENEEIKKACDNYKHISAMQFLKFDFQYRFSGQNGKTQASNNKNAYGFSETSTKIDGKSVDHQSQSNSSSTLKQSNKAQLNLFFSTPIFIVPTDKYPNPENVAIKSIRT